MTLEKGPDLGGQLLCITLPAGPPPPLPQQLETTRSPALDPPPPSSPTPKPHLKTFGGKLLFLKELGALLLEAFSILSFETYKTVGDRVSYLLLSPRPACQMSARGLEQDFPLGMLHGKGGSLEDDPPPLIGSF